MTALAATNVTLTIGQNNKHVLGRLKMRTGTMAFGNRALTYPYGGVPLPAIGNFGLLQAIDGMNLSGPVNNGFQYRYDRTNHKLKMYAMAPLVVFEEVVTMTDGTTYDTGTTKYPMAWPLYASNGNQALGLLPVGMNPVTTTVAIDMHSATPGTRATLTSLHATDDYATITISYITQAWTEVFDNLVEGETMTAGATTTNGITFTAATPDVISFLNAGSAFLCGLMVGLDLNGTVSAPKPCVKGQTTVAGEYALDWTNTSPAATTMSVVTTANWNAATASIKFNYIKKPTSGFLYDRFVEEDAITSSSQIATFAGGNISQPLLLSTPGFIPSVTVSTTSATWPIGGIGMTLGTTAQWQPTNYHMKNRAVTAATFTSGTGALANLAVKPSYIYGIPDEVPTVEPLELPNLTAVPATTLDFMAWGI